MSVPSLARYFIAPMGIAVIGVTALAWYVSFTTTDSLMAFTMDSPGVFGPRELAIFYVLMTVMMVAMMLPATLPMVLGYRQLLRSGTNPSGGAHASLGTIAFMAPYILLWGAFGVFALVGLSALGWTGPMVGLIAFVPGLVLAAAGVYQVTSVKQACLRQCQPPFTFVLGRWRKGLRGAFRMGLSHSVFCLGCCWLFMIALFVVGAMNLVWMGAVSMLIFVEKVGVGRAYTSRAIGVIFLLLGLLVSAQTLLMM